MTLKEKIVRLLKDQSGQTDREITNILFGKKYPQQSINQACRALEQKGIIIRKKEIGKIRNYLSENIHLARNIENNIELKTENNFLSEDQIKKILEKYLNNNGWNTSIAWGKSAGVDILALRNSEKWIIEVKGCGSLNPMRVNYFLGVLGEILQRMDEEDAKYSVAFPDLKQFRNLWNRLPKLAKDRTGISALFINYKGNVLEQQ